MVNINYRKINENDAYRFEYVAAHSWKDTYWNMLPHEILENRIKRLDNSEQLKEKLISTQKFIIENIDNIFVVTDNDNLIGFVEVAKGKKTYESFGYLGSLYLLSEYHKNGIGKELFTLGLKRLIEMGYDKMQLECMEGNETLKFYEKYGGYVIDTIDEIIYGKNVRVNIVLFDNIKELYNTLKNNSKSK